VWAARDEFVGRDGLFYTLEVAARLQRVVLLHGPGGSGKTELAKAFGRWLRDTGGVDDPRLMVWHSFEPGAASFGLDGLLSSIGLQVFGVEFAQLDDTQRRQVVHDLMVERRALVVLDNFESVYSMPDSATVTAALDDADRAELLGFVNRLAAGGRAMAVLTSRSPELWLGEVRRVPVIGLDMEEAAEYADQLLAPYPHTAAARRQRVFGELMEWLAGHPLSMRLTLPLLDTIEPGVLLGGLRGTTPSANPDFSGNESVSGGDDRSASPPTSIMSPRVGASSAICQGPVGTAQ